MLRAVKAAVGASLGLVLAALVAVQVPSIVQAVSDYVSIIGTAKEPVPSMMMMDDGDQTASTVTAANPLPVTPGAAGFLVNQGNAGSAAQSWYVQGGGDSRRIPVYLSTGSAALIGQQNMAASIPVVIASNQSSVLADPTARTHVATITECPANTCTIPSGRGTFAITLNHASKDIEICTDNHLIVYAGSTSDGAINLGRDGPQCKKFSDFATSNLVADTNTYSTAANPIITASY